VRPILCAGVTAYKCISALRRQIDVVLGRITIRGSIVGGRQDLAEAKEFFVDWKVRPHYHERKLEDINQVFSVREAGRLNGRRVMPSF
jgi:propanol-preferring alcohol dehydrogenase